MFVLHLFVSLSFLHSVVFLFLRFYLFKRETERAQAEAEGEADSALSREPDAGLHPRPLGS